VIVRILGVGQFRLDEVDHAAANAIDERVQAAYDAGDEAGFHEAVQELSAMVQRAGTPLDVDEFVGSDAVVPGPDTTLEEAHQLLSSEGLIPG
jgi:PspA-Associated protein